MLKKIKLGSRPQTVQKYGKSKSRPMISTVKACKKILTKLLLCKDVKTRYHLEFMVFSQIPTPSVHLIYTGKLYRAYPQQFRRNLLTAITQRPFSKRTANLLTPNEDSLSSGQLLLFLISMMYSIVFIIAVNPFKIN